MLRNGLISAASRVGGAGFVPSDLASCIGWWDASDTGTITLSGSTVTEWDNKIDGLVLSNTNTPTYDAVNDEVEFGPLSSSGDSLDNSTTSLVSTNDPNLTYVVLLESPDITIGTGISQRFMGLGLGSLASAHVGIGSNGYSWRYNGGAFEVASTVSQDTKYILSFERQTQSTNEIYENGTSLGSGSMTSAINLNTASRTSIGDPGAGSVNAAVNISEVIILEAVSTDDRQKCEGYIAHKWGQTALLPSGHPYKTVAP